MMEIATTNGEMARRARRLALRHEASAKDYEQKAANFRQKGWFEMAARCLTIGADQHNRAESAQQDAEKYSRWASEDEGK